MKKRLLALLFCVATTGATMGIAQSTAEIDKLINQIAREEGMQHSTVSVCVSNAATGKSLYRHNAEVALTPASVVKLFTTGAGFARLGADFRFTTQMAYRGHIDREGVLHGDVYLIGGGDPLLGSYRYRQTVPDSLFDGWTRALRGKGIRRIYGRVCYNASVFDNAPLHDSWQWGDVGNYYAAGVSGLNFHENMYFVYFTPGAQLGKPASVARLQPKNLDIHSICEVTTAEANSGDHVVIYGSPMSKERLYTGTVPLGKPDFEVRGAMPMPEKTCADLFSTYLRTHGISVSSTSQRVPSEPDSLHHVLDYSSTPYYIIAQHTNLTSNNLYAESIFKYMGYKTTGKGSFESGSQAVNQYFTDLGLTTHGVRVVDGSGLSRLNHTTTDFLCRYLLSLRKEPFFDKFLQTLPKVGKSGTARRLLPSLPSNVSVYVKTGTMEGVKSYAGYIITPDGNTYAFAIISNNHECSNAAVAEKMNRILLRLTTLRP